MAEYNKFIVFHFRKSKCKPDDPDKFPNTKRLNAMPISHMTRFKDIWSFTSKKTKMKLCFLTKE